MRIKDMLNSSRQVLFHLGLDGYEYSGRGTCFLCRYASMDVAITPGHVVRALPAAEDVLIPFHQEARAFVPYNALITCSIPDTDDPDWGDLAFFPLERCLYDDSDFSDQPPYAIPHHSAVWRPGMAGHLVTRGFPDDLNLIDYEDGIIRSSAVILEADHVGPSPMAHCHEIEFRDVSMCTTLQGLSGAPVFWLGPDKPHDHRFAGLLLRATHSSRRGHFVHAEVIISAIEKIRLG